MPKPNLTSGERDTNDNKVIIKHGHRRQGDSERFQIRVCARRVAEHLELGLHKGRVRLRSKTVGPDHDENEEVGPIRSFMII